MPRRLFYPICLLLCMLLVLVAADRRQAYISDDLLIPGTVYSAITHDLGNIATGERQYRDQILSTMSQHGRPTRDDFASDEYNTMDDHNTLGRMNITYIDICRAVLSDDVYNGTISQHLHFENLTDFPRSEPTPDGCEAQMSNHPPIRTIFHLITLLNTRYFKILVAQMLCTAYYKPFFAPRLLACLDFCLYFHSEISRVAKLPRIPENMALLADRAAIIEHVIPFISPNGSCRERVGSLYQVDIIDMLDPPSAMLLGESNSSMSGGGTRSGFETMAMAGASQPFHQTPPRPMPATMAAVVGSQFTTLSEDIDSPYVSQPHPFIPHNSYEAHSMSPSSSMHVTDQQSSLYDLICIRPGSFYLKPEDQIVIDLPRCYPTPDYDYEVCAGILTTQYVTRRQHEEEYYYHFSAILRSIYLLSPVKDDCQIHMAKFVCSKVLPSCYNAPIQYRDPEGQLHTLHYPTPQLTNRQVCETYEHRCVDFFNAMMPSRLASMYQLVPACDIDSFIDPHIDCQGQPVHSPYPMFPRGSVLTVTTQYFNVTFPTNRFTEATQGNLSAYLSYNPHISCPKPLILILPDYSKDNVALFGGSCGFPCRDMIFTDDEYVRIDRITFYLSIVNVALLCILCLTLGCSKDFRLSSRSIIPITITLLAFIGTSFISFMIRFYQSDAPMSSQLCDASTNTKLATPLILFEAFMSYVSLLSLFTWSFLMAIDAFINLYTPTSTRPQHTRRSLHVFRMVAAWGVPIVLGVTAWIAGDLGPADYSMNFNFIHTRNDPNALWYYVYIPIFFMLLIKLCLVIACIVQIIRIALVSQQYTPEYGYSPFVIVIITLILLVFAQMIIMLPMITFSSYVKRGMPRYIASMERFIHCLYISYPFNVIYAKNNELGLDCGLHPAHRPSPTYWTVVHVFYHLLPMVTILFYFPTIIRTWLSLFRLIPNIYQRGFLIQRENLYRPIDRLAARANARRKKKAKKQKENPPGVNPAPVITGLPPQARQMSYLNYTQLASPLLESGVAYPPINGDGVASGLPLDPSNPTPLDKDGQPDPHNLAPSRSNILRLLVLLDESSPLIPQLPEDEEDQEREPPPVPVRRKKPKTASFKRRRRFPRRRPVITPQPLIEDDAEDEDVSDTDFGTAGNSLTYRRPPAGPERPAS